MDREAAMDGGSWHAPWKEKIGMHLRPWGVFWGHGGFSGFCVVNNTENPGKRTPKDLTFAELMRYNSFTFRNISYLQGYHKNKPPQKRTAFFLPA